MVKDIAKQILNLFGNINNIRIKKTLVREARAVVNNHPEWAPLKSAEKKYAKYKSDQAQLVIFKNINGELNENFISDSYYQIKLLPKLNKMNYWYNFRSSEANYFLDKNYFDKFIHNMILPKTVLRNIDGVFFDENYIPCSDYKKRLMEYDELVFKKTIASGHGRGVNLFSRDEYEGALEEYGSNFIIQEKIVQSPLLSFFNESSVNIIRITTIYLEKVYVLGAILRVGPPGSFCDLLESGGEHPRIIGINDDGKLMDKVIDPDLCNVYQDCWGKDCRNIEIKKFQEMKKLVCCAHEMYPQYKLIGWDLTLDKDDNIICVEYNADVPGVMQSQYCLGPIFGKQIDENGKKQSILDKIHEL